MPNQFNLRLHRVVSLSLLLCLPCATLVAGTVTQLETLEFDEVPFQPVNNLSISGVTFGYLISDAESDEAFYNSFGPGTLQFVDDPSLTGDSSGVLSLDFEYATPILQFGIAVNSPVALTPGSTVKLFGIKQQAISVDEVDLLLLSGNLGFAENLFSYTGEPVKRAEISFTTPGSFAVDNLAYKRIPEPCSVCFLSPAGGILFVYLKKRSAHSHRRVPCSH